MVKEFCDLCGEKEPNHRFKIKMSKKGYYAHDYLIHWVDDWGRYNKICICEDCAEKLFGILSRKTMVKLATEKFFKAKRKKD